MNVDKTGGGPLGHIQDLKDAKTVRAPSGKNTQAVVRRGARPVGEIATSSSFVQTSANTQSPLPQSVSDGQDGRARALALVRSLVPGGPRATNADGVTNGEVLQRGYQQEVPNRKLTLAKVASHAASKHALDLHRPDNRNPANVIADWKDGQNLNWEHKAESDGDYGKLYGWIRVPGNMSSMIAGGVTLGILMKGITSVVIDGVAVPVIESKTLKIAGLVDFGLQLAIGFVVGEFPGIHSQIFFVNWGTLKRDFDVEYPKERKEVPAFDKILNKMGELQTHIQNSLDELYAMSPNAKDIINELTKDLPALAKLEPAQNPEFNKDLVVHGEIEQQLDMMSAMVGETVKSLTDEHLATMPPKERKAFTLFRDRCVEFNKCAIHLRARRTDNDRIQATSLLQAMLRLFRSMVLLGSAYMVFDKTVTGMHEPDSTHSEPYKTTVTSAHIIWVAYTVVLGLTTLAGFGFSLLGSFDDPRKSKVTFRQNAESTNTLREDKTIEDVHQLKRDLAIEPSYEGQLVLANEVLHVNDIAAQITPTLKVRFDDLKLICEFDLKVLHQQLAKLKGLEPRQWESWRGLDEKITEINEGLSRLNDLEPELAAIHGASRGTPEQKRVALNTKVEFAKLLAKSGFEETLGEDAISWDNLPVGSASSSLQLKALREGIEALEQTLADADAEIQGHAKAGEVEQSPLQAELEEQLQNLRPLFAMVHKVLVEQDIAVLEGLAPRSKPLEDRLQKLIEQRDSMRSPLDTYAEDDVEGAGKNVALTVVEDNRNAKEDAQTRGVLVDRVRAIQQKVLVALTSARDALPLHDVAGAAAQAKRDELTGRIALKQAALDVLVKGAEETGSEIHWNDLPQDLYESLVEFFDPRKDRSTAWKTTKAQAATPADFVAQGTQNVSTTFHGILAGSLGALLMNSLVSIPGDFDHPAPLALKITLSGVVLGAAFTVTLLGNEALIAMKIETRKQENDHGPLQEVGAKNLFFWAGTGRMYKLAFSKRLIEVFVQLTNKAVASRNSGAAEKLRASIHENPATRRSSGPGWTQRIMLTGRTRDGTKFEVPAEAVIPGGALDEPGERVIMVDVERGQASGTQEQTETFGTEDHV